jgi:flagellin
VTGTTGITAEASGGTVTLKQADGKDIRIADFAVTDGTGTINVTGLGGDAVQLENGGGALDSAIVAGRVTFTASETYSVSSSVANTAGSVVDAAANTAVAATASLVSAIDIGTQTGAQNAIDVIDSALSRVTGVRADLGAIQTRFELAISNLQTTSENLTAARSRIKDADFAAETANLTRAQILQQAGTAILAQANSVPQNVLSLLR